MKNLGPLTTVYVPSDAGCHSTHVAIITNPKHTYIQRGTVRDCFPSSFDSDPKSYYSPGICQQGYTYACTGDVGLEGVTGATCCPTGFGCRSYLTSSHQNPCVSMFTSDGYLSVDILSYRSETPTRVGTTTMPYRAGDTVFAKGLVVRRGASDLEWDIMPTQTTATTLARLTSTIDSSATNIITSSEPIAVTSDDPQSPQVTIDSHHMHSQNSSGLSSGAKAGISIPVVIVVLLLVGGLTLTAYRRGKGRAVYPMKQQNPSDTEVEEDIWGEATMSLHEMEEQRRAHELRSTRDLAELMA